MIDKTEQEIMKNWKGDIRVPLVSICTITYNHEKYIAEALDSFLMQETDFPFEVVVDDDSSPDKTAEVIKIYIKKFPKIIKANLREKNIGMMMNFTENMKRAKGKYIALCEGDDYWTNPLKLQMQVDFLETNKDYVYCFHDIDLYIDSEKKFIRNRSSHHNEKFKGDKYYPERILSSRFSFNTLSLMFRNIVERPKCFNNLSYGDKSLEKLFAFYGKGYFIAKSMGVYRAHQNSITHTVEYKASDNKRNDVILYECLRKKFPNKYEQILQTRIDFHKSFIDNIGKLDIDRIKIFYRHASLVSNEKRILTTLYFLYYLVDCKDYKLLKRIITKILFEYSSRL